MSEDDWEKFCKITFLWLKVGGKYEEVSRFMDFSSEKMLDEKIEVLEAIAAGGTPDEIPNFYKVLEKHPDNHPEKYLGGRIRWD